LKKKLSDWGPVFLLIFPFLGFIIALTDIKSTKSKYIYILFSGIFGYSFSFADSSADSFRYAIAFNNFDNTLNINTIIQLYKNGELRDLYRVTLFYFVSLFSENPKVLFSIAGLIYGYLSYKAMLIFNNENQAANKKSVYFTILFLIFYTSISISNINGFKFNTGALLLFLSTYHIFLKNKKIWIIGLLITPLFHYSFIIVLPFFILYLFYPKKTSINVIYTIFIISFFASWILKTNSVNFNFLGIQDDSLGEIGSRLKYVSSEETAELVAKRKENSIFLRVLEIFNYAIRIYSFIVIVQFKKIIDKKTTIDPDLNRYFSFVAFFYSFTSIGLSFPSGIRFMNIACLFLMILTSKFLIEFHYKKIKNLILMALPLFIFNILFINFLIPVLILDFSFWFKNIFWNLISGIDFNL
jgi:hypothetical protein